MLYSLRTFVVIVFLAAAGCGGPPSRLDTSGEVKLGPIYVAVGAWTHWRQKVNEDGFWHWVDVYQPTGWEPDEDRRDFFRYIGTSNEVDEDFRDFLEDHENTKDAVVENSMVGLPRMYASELETYRAMEDVKKHEGIQEVRMKQASPIKMRLEVAVAKGLITQEDAEKIRAAHIAKLKAAEEKAKAEEKSSDQ